MGFKIEGSEEDGGRLTTRALAVWLNGRRDNDLKVVVHGLLVSVGSAYYDRRADAVVLVPLVDEDLRVAMADCPEHLERP